jgi:hypothetical protein
LTPAAATSQGRAELEAGEASSGRLAPRDPGPAIGHDRERAAAAALATARDSRRGSSSATAAPASARGTRAGGQPGERLRLVGEVALQIARQARLRGALRQRPALAQRRALEGPSKRRATGAPLVEPEVARGTRALDRVDHGSVVAGASRPSTSLSEPVR